MNLNLEESLVLSSLLNTKSSGLKNTIVGIAPVPLYFNEISKSLMMTDKNVLVGAQNAHWEDSGACTGEISVDMFQALNADFIITGHSERRNEFSETQALINKRNKGVLDSGLKLIYCIGEKLEEKESGKTLDVVKKQLEDLFFLIDSENIDQLILAYEPVWAIGTGKVATVEEIASVHSSIIEYWIGKSDLIPPPILYGGSVKPNNFAEIISIPEVNGALVGGASLEFESFSGLIDISE